MGCRVDIAWQRVAMKKGKEEGKITITHQLPNED